MNPRAGVNAFRQRKASSTASVAGSVRNTKRPENLGSPSRRWTRSQSHKPPRALKQEVARTSRGDDRSDRAGVSILPIRFASVLPAGIQFAWAQTAPALLGSAQVSSPAAVQLHHRNRADGGDRIRVHRAPTTGSMSPSDEADGSAPTMGCRPAGASKLIAVAASACIEPSVRRRCGPETGGFTGPHAHTTDCSACSSPGLAIRTAREKSLHSATFRWRRWLRPQRTKVIRAAESNSEIQNLGRSREHGGGMGRLDRIPEVVGSSPVYQRAALAGRALALRHHVQEPARPAPLPTALPPPPSGSSC